MLDINFIRENKDKVKKGIKDKQLDEGLADKLLERYDKWTEKLQIYDKLKQKSKEIAKKRKPSEEGRKIKQKLKKAEEGVHKAWKRYKEVEDQIPNLPARDVLFGKGESENKEIRIYGELPDFDFKARDYQELGDFLDLIDIKTSSKVSGTRFGYLKNEAVQLEFALVQLALKTLVKEDFIPVIPPVLIKREITEGLGYWQAGGHNDYYYVGHPLDFYLVGTAEHSIIPMHMNDVLEEKKLPKRYVGFSTCFRREAGTYGKDTRGIFRVHQFDKIEMVSFIEPQANADKKEHEYLLSLAEKLVQALKIPYQVTKMCTGDLGFPTARKYDINCWFPTQGVYRETHSISTCTDFQARRLNIKYREKGKTDFVHTLNGTAFAIGRTILAILENYQQKDGSVEVPKALQKYTGFKKITPKK